MKKSKQPIKAEQPRKPKISDELARRLAGLDEGEQQRVLGFAQGIAYAKIAGKSA